MLNLLVEYGGKKLSEEIKKKQSIEQVSALQNSYNNQIHDLVKKTYLATEKTLNDTDAGKLAEKVLVECKLDMEELLIEGIKVNNNNPYISEEEISIKLLHNIADNKKYKKISKIAKEMLKERWWEK